MKKSFIRFIVFMLTEIAISITTNAQSLTIDPKNTATNIIDAKSTSAGISVPKMTTVQKGNISNKTEGMMVYDTDVHQFSYWTGSLWVNFGNAASPAGWAINGNAGNELKNTNSGGFWSSATLGLDFYTTNFTNPPTAPVSGAGTRLMWLPSRSAFRVGTIYDDGTNGGTNWDASKIGLYSFASGLNTTAFGRISTAMGNFTSASGNASTAMGNITIASGIAATAMGYSTSATGDFSTAMGSFGSTNGHNGSFIIHDNINENVVGITSNSLDNQMIMKFDGGFGFYSGGATDASMGFEKTIGLSVYGKGIRAYGGGNIYTENGGKIGVNTATPNSTFEVNGSQSMPFLFTGTDYSATPQDYTIIANLQSDENKVININLPSPVFARGRINQIKLIQSPGANTRNCIFDREKFGPVFNQPPIFSTDKGYVAIKDYNGDLITCLYEYSAQKCGGGGALLNPIGAFESVLGYITGNPVTNCAYYSASRTCITIQSVGTRWIVIGENLAIDQYKW